MECFDNYIGLHRTLRTSNSNLYVTGLMGVELSAFDDLSKEEQEDFEAAWLEIYERAQINMILDLTGKLNEKYRVTGKIDTRETSESQTNYLTGQGETGVRITSQLSKYMVIEVQTISFIAENAVPEPSPAGSIKVYDKDDALIAVIPLGDVAQGRNIVKVFTEFEDEDLKFKIDTDLYSVRSTINKYFDDGVYDKLICTYPCYFGGGENSVYQLDGGGLNIKFVITCSIRKFLCENLSIFKYALWYKTGVELMRERITSDKINAYTTLTTERATQLLAQYNEDFDKALKTAVDTLKITEDPYCFPCKSFVTAANYLP